MESGVRRLGGNVGHARCPATLRSSSRRHLRVLGRSLGDGRHTSRPIGPSRLQPHIALAGLTPARTEHRPPTPSHERAMHMSPLTAPRSRSKSRACVSGACAVWELIWGSCSQGRSTEVPSSRPEVRRRRSEFRPEMAAPGSDLDEDPCFHLGAIRCYGFRCGLAELRRRRSSSPEGSFPANIPDDPSPDLGSATRGPLTRPPSARPEQTRTQHAAGHLWGCRSQADIGSGRRPCEVRRVGAGQAVAWKCLAGQPQDLFLCRW